MSKKLIVVAALALALLQATPAQASACCIICVGEPPNAVCILPGCDPSCTPLVALARDQDW
ncbi:MAG TPA: hypothetical protein VNU01_04620 [Egibacteraceae bacterium]|nr:hypothetical protein [Egibacteraceae bacterium]